MKRMTAAFAIAAISTAAVASHGTEQYSSLHLPDDINGDLQADIFFSGGTSLAFWQLQSPVGAPAVAATRYAGDGGAGYKVVAVNDFTGDQSADVLWSNGRHLKMWINNGSGSFTPQSVGEYGGGWQPFAAGDINADGRADILFRGATHIAYWLMNGTSVLRSSYAGDGGQGYRVVDVRDFTGSDPNHLRSVDVLWTNGSQLKMWVSNAPTATFQPVVIGSYGGGWEPFAGADVSGDSVADILFRGGTHLAYWEQDAEEKFSAFRYTSRYAGDGGAGFRAIAASEYGRPYGEPGQDILWSNGSELKIWIGRCLRPEGEWGSCLIGEQDFVPISLGTYGNGWQPLSSFLDSP